MINDLPECKFDYENVKVNCPHCNKLNVFNRISDLKTTECISSYNKACAFCGKTIFLGGDLINPAYQMIFYKCYSHKEAKEYMQSIITICTAYEMMFMFILRLLLTVKPLKSFHFAYERIKPNKILNELLEQKVENYTFTKMLNEFIKLMICNDDKSIDSIEKCELFIKNMNGRRPEEESLKQIKNVKLRNILIVLYKLKEKGLLIDNIRNKVVHKQGYRPSLEEVEREIKIARNIIFKITSLLTLITDDVIIYYEMYRE